MKSDLIRKHCQLVIRH